MAAHLSSRLLILGCSATKREAPAYVPAIEHGDDPPWQAVRVLDPNGEKAKVAFLSERLGFRAVGSPIEISDARMTDHAAAMEAGDLGTRWPRPNTQRRVMLPGDDRHQARKHWRFREGQVERRQEELRIGGRRLTAGRWRAVEMGSAG